MTVGEAIAYAEALLQNLTKMTNARIVITGIHLENGDVANLGRDEDGKQFLVRRPHNGCTYPGTGDLFASVLLGELLSGIRFEQACEKAADFTGEVICHSRTLSTEPRYGVALEQHLGRLVKSSERTEP